jgi:hypothetical protein
LENPTFAAELLPPVNVADTAEMVTPAALSAENQILSADEVTVVLARNETATSETVEPPISKLRPAADIVDAPTVIPTALATLVLSKLVEEAMHWVPAFVIVNEKPVILPPKKKLIDPVNIVANSASTEAPVLDVVW